MGNNAKAKVEEEFTILFIVCEEFLEIEKNTQVHMYIGISSSSFYYYHFNTTGSFNKSLRTDSFYYNLLLKNKN